VIVSFLVIRSGIRPAPISLEMEVRRVRVNGGSSIREKRHTPNTTSSYAKTEHTPLTETIAITHTNTDQQYRKHASVLRKHPKRNDEEGIWANREDGISAKQPISCSRDCGEVLMKMRKGGKGSDRSSHSEAWNLGHGIRKGCNRVVWVVVSRYKNGYFSVSFF
jgi:hypothetical protein